MRSSVDMPASPTSQGTTSSSTTTTNNNNNNNNRGNSGSQYALCALGVGLVALGVVMIVWSVVPAEAAGNNSSSSSSSGGGGGGERPGNRNKASSVAFALVGSGVVMLLLALCLGMRNKRWEMQRQLEAQNPGLGGEAAGEPRAGETAEERAERYAVPSYEEAVGSGRYPVRQSNLRNSSSQLPSYDDLVQVDGLQYEFEGSDVAPAGTQPAPASAGPTAAPSNRRAAKTSRKLLPLKIRRIKSEKLHVKNVDNSQPAAGISIEPLTPPPQYEDKVPQL